MSSTAIEDAGSSTHNTPDPEIPTTIIMGPDTSDPEIVKSSKAPVSHTSLEAAAAHLLTAGVGWIAVKVFRLFKRQQKSLEDASDQLKKAELSLLECEQEVRALKGSLVEVNVKEVELDTTQKQLNQATEELQSATSRCQEAAAFLDRTMNNLKVTETELRCARSQLQEAFQKLTTTEMRLDEAQGELGLTKSENEILKRELMRTRKQLESAQVQMERYHLNTQVNRGSDISYDDTWG
ncbi:hypothetical protein CEUSTIGMA_g2782.t1 [Chlamydomonas eustigma]|uniref:Uncharacterized protein n=1 Tax=Chlamydomonas eustigma TaxID=1157962 RepID=A0A250WWY2_9CHLO|nr:hypothetical protein CEUSTIGMA_g2782.t1 [Chlamydomonas eustigma]|eukprot:GAX75337.1 hypothetical protein CEUSTIGMA_g2782.t1 [Chlamydomonas eustigma]